MINALQEWINSNVEMTERMVMFIVCLAAFFLGLGLGMLKR